MRLRYYIFLLIIIAVSLFAFYPAFGLGLFGDDWLSFWKFVQSLGPGSESRHWNYLSYYLTSYGSQDILMGGILRNIYGFNSAPYYVTSYMFKLIAAFSLYPLVFYLTKNKLAAFFAVLFFSVTAIGFDTTNWVFNMPSYLAMAFFSIFLFLFLRAREEKGYKTLLFSGLFYYIAYVTAPIRFTGLLPFIVVIELFWLAVNHNKKTAQKVVLRLLFILLVVIFISKTGTSMGAASDWRERFLGGLTMSQTFLSQGRFDFLFYPIVTFGSFFVPDILMIPGKQFILKTDLFFSLLPFYVLFLLAFTILTKNLPKKGVGEFWKIAAVGFLWLSAVELIFIFNRITFSNGAFIYLLAIGGYMLIIGAYILIKSLNKPEILQAVFVSLAWSILSFLPAWWWAPNTIFPVTHRYLIGSAVGIAVFLSILINLAKKSKTKYTTAGIIIIIIILHIIAARIYINYQLNTHSSEITEKIWSAIPYVPEAIKYPGPKIFYFQAEDGGILHDAITFGFPPHMALIYNMREEDGLTTTPMEDWKDVESAARDGSPFHRYNYFQPLPLEKIFAFRLEGKNNLVNVTDLARKKLQEEVLNKP